MLNSKEQNFSLAHRAFYKNNLLKLPFFRHHLSVRQISRIISVPYYCRFLQSSSKNLRLPQKPLLRILLNFIEDYRLVILCRHISKIFKGNSFTMPDQGCSFSSNDNLFMSMIISSCQARTLSMTYTKSSSFTSLDLHKAKIT